MGETTENRFPCFSTDQCSAHQEIPDHHFRSVVINELPLDLLRGGVLSDEHGPSLS